MDPRCRIGLFGWLHVQRDDRVITRFPTRQTGALLAYLAFHLHRSHPRDLLMEIIWPEAALSTDRHKLRKALTSLRHQLEPPVVAAGTVILADRNSVRLNPDAVTTDVAEFEAALGTAARIPSASERAQRLAAAVELYRGELLPGYYEEWIVAERHRLAEAYQQALGGLVRHLEQNGDFPRALEYARRAVSADPLREEAHGELMRLLAAAGQPEAALRQYRELERLLERELGAAPSAGIRELARAIEGGRTGKVEHEFAQEGTLKTRRGVAKEGGRDAGHEDQPSPVQHSAAGTHLAPGALPGGTVTLLLCDAEPRGSRERVCQEFQRHGGYVAEGMEGCVLAGFARPSEALTAAAEGMKEAVRAGCHQAETAAASLLPRMAVHTCEVELEADWYRGPALDHALRVLRAAHPGQILCSEATAALRRGQVEPGQSGPQLVDLGLYRLGEAGSQTAMRARLFQLGDPNVPPPAFPPPLAPSALAGRLPHSLTHFFGREAELEHLAAFLTAGGHRLVTLTGPGGSGKTRLALALARQVQESLRGAVWFVPLVDLVNPQMIVDRVLESLNLPRSLTMGALEQVIGALSSQPSLVVLDNFEHLAEEGAAVVLTLLEQVETLTLLITSRRRLGVPGEREFQVAPLPVPGGSAFGVSGSLTGRILPDAERRIPSAEALRCWPSVQLFVDRAQGARSDFQITPRNAAVIAQICAQLEGLPLAIELAAARAGALAPAQILSRLSRRFDLLASHTRQIEPRHRSLRAALDSSYQLLSPVLQWFFSRLSVFRGGWTVEAAEAVCDEPRALAYLEELEDASLVVAEETPVGRLSGVSHTLDQQPPVVTEMRFRMLETLREYGIEQLSPAERAALAQQHARCYLALAEQAEPQLRGPEQRKWLDRLESEHDNLRAALAWGTHSEHGLEIALRLAGALWWFWFAHGHLTEGRGWLEEALSAPGAVSVPVRAKALTAAGTLAWRQTDYPRAVVLLEESLTLLRAIGDRSAVAFALVVRGLVERDQSNYELAMGFYREGEVLARQSGYQWGTAFSVLMMGQAVALQEREYGLAVTLLEESLTLFRELGDSQFVATTLSILGHYVLPEQEEYGRATLALEESLWRFRELGEKVETAFVLNVLGLVALRQGDLDQALALEYESLTLFREHGHKRGMADSMEGVAAVRAAQGQLRRAVRLWGAAAALRDAIGTPHPPASRDRYRQALDTARAALGDAAFATAWEQGRSVSLSQAVAEALDEAGDEMGGLG